MYYEINIARNKKHFFATAPRSITSRQELREAVEVFREKFPESEGYEITATYQQQTGERLDIDKL